MNSNNLIQKILQSSDSHPSFQQEDTLQMIIELEGSKSASITITIHDDPQTLAKLFCYKNNVDPKVISILANNIRNAQNSLIPQTQHVEKQNQSINKRSMVKQVESVKNHKQSTSQLQNQDSTFISSTTLNVFDRLYKQSKSRLSIKNNTQPQSSTKRPNHNNSTMDCSLIYERNIKFKQQCKRKQQILLENKKAEQLAQCTHIPKINGISNCIAQKIRNSYTNISKLGKRQERIVSMINEKQMKQLEQCTFKPKLISKSKQKAVRTLSDRHILLHEDHILRENKMNNVREKYLEEKTAQKSFINNISRDIVKDKDFFCRMREYEEIKKSNIQKIAKNSLSKQKKQNKKTLPKRDRGNLSIGDFLYQRSKNNLSSHKCKNQQPILKKRVLNKSQMLYEDMKKIAFRYLFTLMDNDEDGFISSTSINVYCIDAQILKIISPLLCEMEEVGAQLNQKEFVDCLQRLFQTLSVLEKNKLLQVYKQPQCLTQQHSFQPALNQNSLEMARHLRDPGQSLYQIWKETRAQKQISLNQLRTMKQIYEQQECTFHPQIHMHY